MHSPPLQDPTTHATQHTQQHSHGPAGILRQDFKPATWLARYHSLGEGYEQAHSVLGPEQGTGQGQLSEHATEILQKNPTRGQHKGKLTDPGHKTWAHQANTTDPVTLSMHAVPSASQHHHYDSDHRQNSLKGANKYTELAPRSARHPVIPSGKDTGTPALSSGLGRGVSTDCKPWQARSCNCRPFILHERARCTHDPKHGHRNKKQTSRADPCVRLI